MLKIIILFDIDHVDSLNIPRENQLLIFSVIAHCTANIRNIIPEFEDQ